MAKKIMVVEDDPIIVNYLISIFKEHRYLTCYATDGVEAYEVLQKEHPDLITLDLEMKEAWGTRFYRRLSKSNRLKNIPVIVISGLPGSHLAIKKAIATIKKPFNPEQLMSIVKKTIGEPDSDENG